MVQQEIQAAASRGQFNVRDSNLHIHNGVDAPFAFETQAIYGGLIQEDGTPLLAPTGWKIEKVSTGTYDMTHNLGSELCVAVASPVLSGSAPVCSVLAFPNVLEISWYDTISHGFKDTTFYFIMINTQNKSRNPVKYTSVNG